MEYTLPELGLRISLEFYRANVVRVRKFPLEGAASARPSVAVVAIPEEVAVKVVDATHTKPATFSTDALTVELCLATGRIRFCTAAGQVLLSEKPEGASFPVGDYGKMGELLYTGARQAFRLDPHEALYGLGQHQTGRLNQRQQHLLLSQINMESAIPFVQSTKGYGLFWDNSSPTDFLDDPCEMSFRSQANACIDYYFVGGGSADAVLANYQWLTGQPPVPPLWTFGYCQSKERYASQFELEETVRKYRELGVPLDVIIQDWRYWGDAYNEWNGLVFRKDGCFPDMKGAVDRIHAMNAKVFISIWPNFGRATQAYQQMESIGALMHLDNTGSPDASIYDPWMPEARDLYWTLLQKELVPSGVDAWWMDATEPEHTFRPVQCMWEHDDPLDRGTAAGPFRMVRNEYPLVHVEGVMTRQRRDFPTKRPVVLTRSAYAGQQRTGAFVWSGDVKSTWEAFRRQLPAALNFSMSGNPLWNSDIGGFFGCAEFPAGIYEPGFRELYVRWLQFATFCPMMRSHGTGTPREIWQFGQRGTWAFDAIETGIHLRYQLLPYLYSLAHSIARKGGAFLYPIALEEPENTALQAVSDEFTLGHNLLVAPITQPLYVHNQKEDFSTVKTRSVTLPSGTWYDFYTEESRFGTFEAPAPIDHAPLFVRAGTILPLGPRVQFSSEHPWDDLEIRIYPGADGAFTLTEDAGDGLEYEQGQLSHISFTWDDASQMLHIGARQGEFPGMLTKRLFRIHIVDRSGACAFDYEGAEAHISFA